MMLKNYFKIHTLKIITFVTLILNMSKNNNLMKSVKREGTSIFRYPQDEQTTTFTQQARFSHF